MALLSLQACEQNEDVLIPGNKQPDYKGVPTIAVWYRCGAVIFHLSPATA